MDPLRPQVGWSRKGLWQRGGVSPSLFLWVGCHVRGRSFSIRHERAVRWWHAATGAGSGPEGKSARRPVSRVLSSLLARRWMTIPLGCMLPCTSSNLPGRHAGMRVDACFTSAVPIRSCFWQGLPCHLRYRKRGALLPHPFTLARRRLSACTGGLLSVALSLGSPPPGVTRYHIPVKPGLSSPALARRGGHPAIWQVRS